MRTRTLVKLTAIGIALVLTPPACGTGDDGDDGNHGSGGQMEPSGGVGGTLAGGADGAQGGTTGMNQGSGGSGEGGTGGTGGTGNSGAPGGASGSGGKGGMSARDTVAECKASVVGDACNECSCEKCIMYIDACYANEACTAISDCATESGCSGIDCYGLATPGPCRDEIDAGGGLFSQGDPTTPVGMADQMGKCRAEKCGNLCKDDN